MNSIWKALCGTALIVGLSVAVCPRTAAPQSEQEGHVAWVARSLATMQTIRPGMTRADLLKVFTTEGGLSSPLRRTYVYRECLLFKVDVEFTAVGRPGRDAEGRVTSLEDDRDLIKRISKPYVGQTIVD